MTSFAKLKRVLQLLICASGLWGASFVTADAAESIRFNIKSQPLVPALQAFAAQANMQLLYRHDVVQGRTGNAIVGTYEKKTALQQLIQGTGLEIVFSADNAASIGTREEHSSSVSSVASFQLAQTDAPEAGQKGNRAEPENQSKDGGRAIEEIIVTAQKRKESLQEVPISISVLTGAELDKSSAQGTTEMLSRVPGVAVNVGNQGGGTQLTVRGVSASAPVGGGASPIAYYIDSVPFGFTALAFVPDPPSFDLERIEVLRGPQGTLYGAGGAGGVVRVLTKDANPGAFELKARTSMSSTHGGGENYRGDMAINVPLVADKLAVRAVLGYSDLSGWIDAPNAGKEDMNDAQLGNARVKVKWLPTENLSIGLSAWASRDDYGAPPASGENARLSTLVPEAPLETDFTTYGLDIGYDFQAFSISSATSYIDYSTEGEQDIGIFITPTDPTPPPQVLFTGLASRVLSQEVLLNSTHAGPWQWSLGAFYRDAEEPRIPQFLNGVDITPPGIDFRPASTSESYAVFGELSRRFFHDQLKWTLGLRYFEDDRVDVNPTALPVTFKATTPRAVLTWTPSDDLSVYASYSQGFRSGLFQGQQVKAQNPNFPDAEPDKLHNYELGTKGSALNQRLSFEVALYYIDWKDIQQSLSVTVATTSTGAPVPGSAFINSTSASGFGADLTLTAHPAEGLSLGAALSWNDLTQDEDVRTLNVAGVPTLVFLAGDRLTNSPEYTAGVFADYAFPIGGSGFQGRIEGSVNYTSSRDRLPPPGTRAARVSGGDIMVSRASFSLEGADHWSAMLYVDNINNEEDTVLPAAFPEANARLRPRTYGIQLEYRY